MTSMTIPRERTPLAAFVAGFWLNRRYTRLSSSIILGVTVSGTLLAVLWTQLPEHPLAAPSVITMLISNAIFYPAAREGYYRVTQPMREGLQGIFLIGIFALIGLLARLIIFVLLWQFAVPLGILSGSALGIAEARGRGWRLTA